MPINSTIQAKGNCLVINFCNQLEMLGNVKSRNYKESYNCL